MRVLDIGKPITTLRFTADGQRLVVGWWTPEEGLHLELCSFDGERFPVPLPAWYGMTYGRPITVHPVRDIVYVAWGEWVHSFRTTEAAVVPCPTLGQANQMIVSADGTRVVLAQIVYADRAIHYQVQGVSVAPTGHRVDWDRTLVAPFALGGFLPDGERFLTVDDGAVRLRAFATGEELTARRYPTYNINDPQLSPDGRHLGIIGYSTMYLYDVPALGKPRKFASTRSFGDFRSFAFHPDGRTLAVIHGGPTLVKLYDVDTLKLRAKYSWKVGALQAVAFSPDGMLGAAGGEEGRVVLWDVDD
ncbi:MAG: hypothetical protein U0736_26605 [Gemmataceae bacterium]